MHQNLNIDPELLSAIHGGKTKNKKIDSYKIAKLLMGGNLPMAYPYLADMRATRDLLRRRTYMVRQCALLEAISATFG